MRSHKDLEVWKNSIDLVTILYKITENFPHHEQFGLTGQVRRAAVSIPSNIAEGAARNHNKEFIQFLYIALGSSSEIETQLIIAEKLNYLNKEKLDVIDEKLRLISSQILGLIKSLKR